MQHVKRFVMSLSLWAFPIVVSAQERTLANPLTGKAEALGLASIVGRFVKAILGASGVVAAIVIIIAGLRIIFSQGSEDAIAQGKRALLWAILGLVVGFGGYLVIDLILESGAQFLR